MWNLLARPASSVRSWRRSPAAHAAWLAVALLTLAACGSPTAGPVPTSTAAPNSPAATNTPASTGPYPVRVYFSKNPDSYNDPTKVFPVDRSSPTLNVATFAIEQLIAGPTAAEKSAGYFSEIHGLLSGSSNCGGPDFQITLDHRGSTPATGYATVAFCRTTSLPGDLAGAYISAEITTTLKQFPNIKNVVILNSQGDCLDDLSGQNRCLLASTTYPVLVFFSKNPDSYNDPTKVYPVNRTAPTLSVATFAIQQLIAGPTATEKSAGYFSELHGALNGSSNCGGPDFQITLDHKGSTPAAGYVTLKFCRATSLPGDLSGAYIRAEITAILLQFPNNHHVVILNSQGGCFDDLSGQNLCLK